MVLRPDIAKLQEASRIHFCNSVHIKTSFISKKSPSAENLASLSIKFSFVLYSLLITSTAVIFLIKHNIIAIYVTANIRDQVSWTTLLILRGKRINLLHCAR